MDADGRLVRPPGSHFPGPERHTPARLVNHVRQGSLSLHALAGQDVSMRSRFIRAAWAKQISGPSGCLSKFRRGLR